MNNNDPAGSIATRSKTKLRLVIDDTDFAPPHRSTQQLQPDPIQQLFPSSFPPTTPITTEVPVGPTAAGSSHHTTVPTVSRPSTSTELVPGGTTSDITKEDTQTHENSPSDEYQLHSPRRITIGRMANTTLHESMSAEKIPATPKFLCPSLFNPCTDDARQFIKQYERTSAANGWNNTLKITYLGTFLEGAANKWFERYKDEDLNAYKTWSDIKEDFLEEFGTTHPTGFLEGQLYARKQKDAEGIKEYYYSLLDLYGEYNPDLNLREYRKFFENGMKRELYTHYRLVMEDEPDWKSFRRAIEKLDDIARNMPTQNNNQCSCHCQHSSSATYQYRQRTQGKPTWTQSQTNGRQAFRPNMYPRSQDTYQKPHNDSPQWRANGTPPPRFNNRRNDQNWQDARRPDRWPQRETALTAPQTNNTRNHDGRPKCYKCNRVGHHPSACRTNPNFGGRRM